MVFSADPPQRPCYRSLLKAFYRRPSTGLPSPSRPLTVALVSSAHPVLQVLFGLLTGLICYRATGLSAVSLFSSGLQRDRHPTDVLYGSYADLLRVSCMADLKQAFCRCFAGLSRLSYCKTGLLQFFHDTKSLAGLLQDCSSAVFLQIVT